MEHMTWAQNQSRPKETSTFERPFKVIWSSVWSRRRLWVKKDPDLEIPGTSPWPLGTVHTQW